MDAFPGPRPFYLSLFIVLLFCSCSHKKQQDVIVKRAYYYWRTETATPGERKFLKQHEVRKVYKRILDVDWIDMQGAIPVASSELESLSYDIKTYDSFPIQIVPVVFITNKTFERINGYDLRQLALRLVRRCLPAFDSIDVAYERRNYYFASEHERADIREIQFDCDWTEKTADNYFKLLTEVKELLKPRDIRISATIRLHQFKYPSKTGVPPVNRGMLMLYNISNPTQYGNINSIFDFNKAKEYFTSGKSYSLPLDIALPAWSWCLVYRNHEFYQIENGLDEKDLKELSFLKPAPNHFYQVTADTVYRDLFLRPGDEIKAEGIDEKTLQQVAELAKKAVNTDEFTVSLFELSEKEIKNYSDEIIDKVYTSFK